MTDSVEDDGEPISLQTIKERGWRIEQQDGYAEIFDDSTDPPTLIAHGWWVIGPAPQPE